MPRCLSKWFRLLRVPNLFSAPGDAFAGLFLAALITRAKDTPTAANCLWLAAASSLAYAFGILTNDLCDLKEDRLHRPERPLPSGAISVPAAIIAALATAAASAFCAWNATATHRTIAADAILLAVIMLYNGAAKRQRFFGSITMGLCRGCNVILGMAACSDFAFRPLAPSDWQVILPAFIPAAAVTLVIAAVTWMADGENDIQCLGPVAFLPAAMTLLSWPAALCFVPWTRMFPTGAFCLAFLCFAYAAGSQFLTGLALFRNDAPPSLTQPAIGAFIRTLLPWQMAWIILHGTLPAFTVAAATLLAWLLAHKLAQRFPQT